MRTHLELLKRFNCYACVASVHSLVELNLVGLHQIKNFPGISVGNCTAFLSADVSQRTLSSDADDIKSDYSYDAAFKTVISYMANLMIYMKNVHVQYLTFYDWKKFPNSVYHFKLVVISMCILWKLAHKPKAK